jgi:ABC-type Fe3+ transport system substrate-binding protein
MLLRENGILMPYASPELAKYPEEAKTKADGSRVYWVTLGAPGRGGGKRRWISRHR